MKNCPNPTRSSPFLQSAQPRPTLAEFLESPRIHRWYAQNFDVTSTLCSTNGCSMQLHQKVRAYPIGVDFHTFGEKCRQYAGEVPEPCSPACKQQLLLEGL